MFQIRNQKAIARNRRLEVGDRGGHGPKTIRSVVKKMCDDSDNNEDVSSAVVHKRKYQNVQTQRKESVGAKTELRIGRMRGQFG